MRLLTTTGILVFLFACSSDGRKTQSVVLSPARLKAIMEKTRKGNVNSEPAQAGGQINPDINYNKRQKQGNKPVSVVNVTDYIRPDTVRLKNIESLRASGIQADFSEPLNRNLILKQGSDTLYKSAITLSPDKVLKIGFDNDLFDNTDRFYTNGVRIEYVAPAISDNPIKHMLLPYWSHATNNYGISMVQNLYTPSTTKIGGIHHGDRPYASYLYFGSFKITNDEHHHFRQASELDLGVIGQPSLGGSVQYLFHKYIPYNNEPQGWEYQICTDAVISYNISLEKGVISSEHIQLILIGTSTFGTLYDNIGGGASLRMGWFNDYFSDLGVRKKSVLKTGGLRLVQYFFTIKGAARLVAYDATLEGGLINHNSPYTIPASAVSGIVTQSSLGFTVTYGSFGLELEQIILSPEFNHKWWHAWGHIGILFAL